MEDRYEVFCFVNNDSHKGIVLLKEERGSYQIELQIGDRNFTACEYDEYASIKEQYDYYEKWLASRRKTI